MIRVVDRTLNEAEDFSLLKDLEFTVFGFVIRARVHTDCISLFVQDPDGRPIWTDLIDYVYDYEEGAEDVDEEA